MPSALARARGFLRSDFARHGLLVFASTTLINAFGYLFHFVISRRIGVDAYGVLSALNAGLMMSLTFAIILGTIVVKYAAEFEATANRAHLATLVRRVLGFGGAAAALVLVAGLLAASGIAGFLRVGDVRAVGFTVAVVALSLALPPLRAIFQGIQDFRTFAVSAVLESLGKTIFGIGFVYAGLGVAGAFAGWLLGSVVSLVYTVVVLLRRFEREPGAPFPLDLRRLVRTTAAVAVATIVLSVVGNADVLLVKHYAEPHAAGLYGALALSGKILFFFVAFVPTIVLPKATAAALEGRSPMPILVQAVGLTVGISAVGLAGFALAPGLVVTALAGPSFAGAAPYVLGYGFAMVLLAALNVLITYRIGVHRFGFVPPLVLAAAGEIAGIAYVHGAVGPTVLVLVVGNAAALVASAFGIAAPAKAPLGQSAVEAAA